MTAHVSASELSAVPLAVFAARRQASRQRRVEWKHCVPEDVAAGVLRIARIFLHPERGMRPGDSQEIRSLYLDDADATFYRRHVEQAADRFKLRIRAYGSARPENVYVEIKRKTRSISEKRRARIPSHMLPLVLATTDLSLFQLSDRAETEHLQDFVWQRLMYAATPQLITRSIRESLRGPSNDVTAVTVDRSVAYRPARSPEFCTRPEEWRALELPHVTSRAAAIVEVKHGDRPPAWLVPLLQRLEPWRVSFSKYVAARKDMEPWRN